MTRTSVEIVKDNIYEIYQDKIEQEISEKERSGEFSREELKQKIFRKHELNEHEIMFIAWAIDAFKKRLKRRGNKFRPNLIEILESMYLEIGSGKSIAESINIVANRLNISPSYLKKLWIGLSRVNPYHEECMNAARASAKNSRGTESE